MHYFANGNFWVYADNAFTEEQRQLLRTASIKLHDRMRNQRSVVLKCTYDRANRDKPGDRQTINNQLTQVFVNAASGRRPIKLTVTRLWSDTTAVGLAPIGSRDYQFPEKGDLLRIALNSSFFGYR